MTRKMLIVSSFLLAGAVSVLPGTGGATEPATGSRGAALWSADVRVPLPVARPDWSGRASNASGVRYVAQTGTSTAVPAPDGTSMKSGSAEALAVQLEGAKVVSSEGDVVGQVEKVIDEPGNGRQAVVSIGGFLGIGSSSVLIPADTLAPSGSGMVRTELSAQQLKSLPTYKE